MPTQLKLSEAIREGAKKFSKTEDEFFSYNRKGEVVACDALGGAYYTLTGEPSTTPMALLTKEFPALGKLETDPFKTEGRQSTIEGIIIFANDWEGWSREQIADWLESIGY